VCLGREVQLAPWPYRREEVVSAVLGTVGGHVAFQSRVVSACARLRVVAVVRQPPVDEVGECPARLVVLDVPLVARIRGFGVSDVSTVNCSRIQL
jgi:UDP:flavonoid glycosyltransferase YjiC (YdhE family)